MSSNVKLSICTITYNQHQFVRQTLDSILSQKTDFEYEIVVGDDASTDGTREIIQEYQRAWPKRIKPILREKNVGMQKNGVDVIENCRGEYIAFLEGDDYWTDPNKIQLQIEYLDKHSGCSFVHHKVEHIAWPTGTTLGEYPPPRFRVERPNPRDLAMVNFIQTCSLMCRRDWLPTLDEQFQELKLGDWPLCVLLSERGWIGYLDRTMAHYRVHSNNSWNNRSSDYKMRAMEKMAWYLLTKVGESSKDVWRDTILALAFKDFIMALASISPRKCFEKLSYFLATSARFHKQFWLINRLWPYYRANYLAKRASE
jgi:glycosyltransferase involved in cell wall biosynthesis